MRRLPITEMSQAGPGSPFGQGAFQELSDGLERLTPGEGWSSRPKARTGLRIRKRLVPRLRGDDEELASSPLPIPDGAKRRSGIGRTCVCLIIEMLRPLSRLSLWSAGIGGA